MPYTRIYSSDYVTELDPYFFIKVNGIPLSQEDQLNIKYVQIIYEENKRTLLKFEYWDKDKDKLDNPIFKLGQKIEVDGGYRTKFQTFGPFDVDLADEKIVQRSFYIVGSSGGTLNKRVRRRVFSSGSILDVIQRVADEHGFYLKIEGDPNIDLALTEDNALVQSGETDMQFIQRVANAFGILLRTEANSVILSDAIGSNLDVVELLFDRADATIEDIKVKFSKPQIKRPTSKIDIRCKGKKDNPLITTAEDGSKYVTEVLKVPNQRGVFDPLIETASDEEVEEAFSSKLGISEGSSVSNEDPCDPGVSDPDWKEDNDFVQVDDQIREAANAQEIANAGTEGIAQVGQPGLIDSAGNAIVGILDTGRIVITEEDQYGTKTGILADGPYTATLADLVREEKHQATNSTGNPDPSLDSANIKPEGIPSDSKTLIKNGRVLEVYIRLKFGSIIFKTRTKVILRNLGKRVSGEYNCKKVVHTWGNSGYTTEITLASGFAPPERPRDTIIPDCPNAREQETVGTEEPDEGGEESNQRIEQERRVQINEQGVRRIETTITRGRGAGSPPIID
jgi:phage protein D